MLCLGVTVGKMYFFKKKTQFWYTSPSLSCRQRGVRSTHSPNPAKWSTGSHCMLFASLVLLEPDKWVKTDACPLVTCRDITPTMTPVNSNKTPILELGPLFSWQKSACQNLSDILPEVSRQAFFISVCHNSSRSALLYKCLVNIKMKAEFGCVLTHDLGLGSLLFI